MKVEIMKLQILTLRGPSLPRENVFHRGLRSSVFRLQSGKRGFTLIELLVAMAILMIIVLMLANLFQQSTRAWSTGLHETTLGVEARAVINMIQRDLSMALPDTDATPIEVGGSSVSFYLLNEEGEPERITYSGGGSSISRNGSELVDNVESFEVELLTAPGPNDTTIADLVEITIRLAGDTRIAGARVYAEGREWDSDLLPVDTQRGE